MTAALVFSTTPRYMLPSPHHASALLAAPSEMKETA